MSSNLLHETIEIKHQLNQLYSSMQVLQLRVDELLWLLRSQTAKPKRSFQDLEGIWAGATWDFAEIQAVEYKLPKDL